MGERQLEPCRFGLEKEGVLECLEGDGWVRWAIEHPGLGEKDNGFGSLQDEMRWEAIAGPIQMGDSIFYGVRTDLLELKLIGPDGAPRVVSRVRFPRWIESVSADESSDVVEVLLGSHGPREWTGPRPEERTIRWRVEGGPPGQYKWDEGSGALKFLYSAAKLDADAWMSRRLSTLEVSERLTRLEQLAQQDPTNPYFMLSMGKLLLKDEQNEAAARAFDQVAQAPALWFDLLAMSAELVKLGAYDASKQAFERGFEQMVAHGIEPEQLTWGLAPIALMGGGATEQIKEALAAGDAERVDELIERYFRIAPLAEHWNIVAADTAQWMETHDQPELAKKWHDHAQRAAQGAANRLAQKTPVVDRALFWMVSLDWSLNILLGLLGFYLGIWLFEYLKGRGILSRILPKSGAELAADADELPRWPWGEVASIIVSIIVCTSLLAAVFRHAAPDLLEQTQALSAPVGVSHSGWGAPDIQDWLEDSPQSPEQQKLLEVARTTQNALREGRALEPVGSLEDELYEVFVQRSNPARTDRDEIDAARRSLLSAQKDGWLFYLKLILGSAILGFCWKIVHRRFFKQKSTKKTSDISALRRVLGLLGRALVFSALSVAISAGAAWVMDRDHLLGRVVYADHISKSLGLRQSDED